MEPSKSKLPPSGPLPRPKSLDEAREILKTESFEAPDVQEVTLEAMEFTSICPKTGQPDFGQVTITYTPKDRCLESKAVKFYLWAYRDEGAFCESLAASIADDVVYAVDPLLVEVNVHQNMRGGIAIIATAERGSSLA